MLTTIQYLEDSPKLAQLDPAEAAERIHRAHDALPFSHLLIGWNLPQRVMEACRNAAKECEVRFIRWHPLLTGDGSFIPRQEWQLVGLQGKRISGFQNKPEFTFVCPNHPEAAETVFSHISELASSGIYEGFFLDRVRFPSPASAPLEDLGCFCRSCQDVAGLQNLDLPRIQSLLQDNVRTSPGRLDLVSSLLDERKTESNDPFRSALSQFLDFRISSITRFVGQAVQAIQTSAADQKNIVAQSSFEIGLDCFSPGLCTMVGQDLAALSLLADWIKVMTYAHTMGPAGLPFELHGLVEFLVSSDDMDEKEALYWIGQRLGILLPGRRAELVEVGLSSQALQSEVRRGVKTSSAPLLAGIELVEIAGVASINTKQILDDLQAVKAASPAGLSISWDLLDIPLERLKLVGQFWE